MIDPKKTYRTRDGREVRIYAVDGGGIYPVHGAHLVGKYEWKSGCWTRDGDYQNQFTLTDNDLIEVRPRIQREVWVNVYPKHVADVVHRDKATADTIAYENRIACVKLVIDCEEEEGL